MAESSEMHALPDFAVVEISLDDLLEGDLRMDDGLPEFDADDILGLHTEEDPEEDLLGVEASDASMEPANPDDVLHFHGREAVKAILHLNVDAGAPHLQEQLDTKPATAFPVPGATTGCYMTSEATPKDDTQTMDEIDFPVEDIEYNSDDSGHWSTEVNVPDDAKWCMSNVPDWEPGFNAWCSAHHGLAFHRMLPHCVVQCTACLAMFSLTSDGFWYSQN